jgi:uncharacterized membrane protein
MVLLILFYLFFPLVIIYLTNKFTFLNKIGAVLLAYFFGLVVGNIGVIPDKLGDFQQTFSGVSVLIAIPLLLFSLNIRDWFKMAGKSFFSGFILTIAVAISVVSGYFIFLDKISGDWTWQVTGMYTGVYTGGTPNMAAIATALNVDSDFYITAHTYDMFVSMLFILLAMSFLQRIGLLIMPAYKMKNNVTDEDQQKQLEELESYKGFFKKGNLLPLLSAFGLSILIFGISFAMMKIFKGDMEFVVAILTITTLAIAFSLIPKVNRIPKTFNLGMYFILIFSLVVSSMGDLNKILDVSQYPNLLIYDFYVVFGTLIIGLFLSALFKIDVDTTIINMVALIFSPPFVPVVAAKLKNKEIIISGITVGLFGYAIGNYLGIFIAYSLK